MTGRLPLLLTVGALVLLAANPAAAQPSSRTTNGHTLTVSQATDLAPAGQRVRVTGRNYDQNKGIYVAFCVDTGEGVPATPCGGGPDTEGSSGNSAWISDFPPYYGTGLAQKFGPNGTFDVTINVRAQLNETVDCRKAKCAVVTRTDHTRSDDRSADVRVPITFKVAPATTPKTTAGKASPSGTTDAGSAAVGSDPTQPPPSPSVMPTSTPTATASPGKAIPQLIAATSSPAVRSLGDPTQEDENGSSWGWWGGLAGLIGAGAAGGWWRWRRGASGA